MVILQAIVMVKAHIWVTEAPESGKEGITGGVKSMYNFRLYTEGGSYLQELGIEAGEKLKRDFLGAVEEGRIYLKAGDISRGPPPGYKSPIGEDRPITRDEIRSVFPVRKPE
jgi:hypothetical protein